MPIETTNRTSSSSPQKPIQARTVASEHDQNKFKSPIKISMNELKLASLQQKDLMERLEAYSDNKIIRKEGKHVIREDDSDRKASANTVVCDGKGDLRPDYATKPKEKIDEVQQCIKQHEEKHIEQVKRTAPNICKGGQEMNGRIVRLSPEALFEGKSQEYEKEAWDVSMACLENKIKTEEDKEKPDMELWSQLKGKFTMWKFQYIDETREIYNGSK